MKNARILILEDNPKWVETISDVLAPLTAHVASAQTLAEAQRLLDACYFNVAIVDVSLQPGDATDRQGMRFLEILRERHLQETIRPILLSVYATKDLIREAFRDHQIVDFLEKEEVELVKKTRFDPEELFASVRSALAKSHLNRDVELEIAGDRSLSDLWADFEWARREDPEQLAPELADLLRRLFPRAERLFLAPMTAGQSGAGILEVEPIYGAQVGEPVVVKFGKKEKIRQEQQNYREHIAEFVGAYVSTQLDHVLGRVMGAIRYSLVGTKLGALDSFADYYARHDVESIRRALHNVFTVTCGRWYDNKEQPRARRNLVALYERGLHIRKDEPNDEWTPLESGEWQAIWRNAARIGIDLSDEQLRFPGVLGSFPNPRKWLQARNAQIYLSAWRAITHGDLNEHNILVTDDGRCWLIDFYRTGWGHILRDVVELETTIKFNLTATADLEEHHQLEKQLLAQTRIDRPPAPAVDHPHHKALSTIGHLRFLADNFTGTDKDMVEYNVALLLTTLNLLRLDFLKEQHAKMLLSAAMLCAWLEDDGGL